MPSVIVIGAGAVGASIAYRLAASGASVTLVDAGEAGGETTSRSFAWLNANYKPPDPYHRLNAEGIEAHHRLGADLGRAPWLHATGNLQFAGTDDAARTLHERIARLSRLDYPAEVIGLARAGELEPAVSYPDARAIAFFPREGWAHGPTLARTLAEAVRALGGAVRPWTRVVAIEPSATGVSVQVQQVKPGTGAWPRGAAGAGPAAPAQVTAAPSEALSCDRLVIAAGRYSDRVAALAGLRVDLAPTCGLLAVTSPIERGPTRISYLPGVHLRPDGDGRLVLQDGDTDAQMTPDTPEDAALPAANLLLERAQRYVPALSGARVEAVRVGIRSLPADGFPIVGPAPAQERLYLAVTHSGMTLGPLLGELAAAEILGGQPDPRLTTFRPGR